MTYRPLYRPLEAVRLNIIRMQLPKIAHDAALKYAVENGMADLAMRKEYSLRFLDERMERALPLQRPLKGTGNWQLHNSQRIFFEEETEQ